MRLIGVVLAAFVALPGFGKSLSWDAVEVRARLDSVGRLEVVERQTILFDGDWNGGQRTFRLEPRQKVRLESLVRIDPRTRERVALRKGDLDQVDEFKWTDSTTLRWRSRLPSDPPFASEAITYELQYTMRNILVHRQDDEFVLDHDFSFPDRDGVINRFRLDLQIDPVWQTGRDIAPVERENLAPGQQVIVNIPVVWTGEGDAPGVVRPAPVWLRAGTGIVVLLVAIMGLRGLVERERKRGRFAQLVQPSAIDRAWLEENLFSIPPEVVGATWDRTVASPEVAAMLARLVSEKKLKSWTEKRSGLLSTTEILHLELLVPRDAFAAAERKLIDALFPKGVTATNTDFVRKHYKNKGFDPASKIRSHLRKAEEKLFTRTRAKEIPPPLDTRVILVAFGVAIGCFVVTVFTAPDSVLMLVVTGFGLSLLFLLVAIPAGLAKDRVEKVAVWIGVPAAVLLLMVEAARWLRRSFL